MKEKAHLQHCGNCIFFESKRQYSGFDSTGGICTWPYKHLPYSIVHLQVYKVDSQTGHQCSTWVDRREH